MRSASANTASMSCSISTMVSFDVSTFNISTMRADSSGPMPAIGSSSSSMRGPVASAIAISSWRCSPWLRLAQRSSARCARPTCASTARAGSRNSGSVRALRQKRNECPACACTASATLSSVVKSRKSDVIWNERASPSALRSCTGSAVMSRPSKRTAPESGAISPVSCPISVLLPAPFGPMMACSSPGGMASEMPSEATTPPKRLVRLSIARRASATAHALQQTIDAAAREQHHQEKQRSEHDLPILRDFHRDLWLDHAGCDQPDQHRQRLFQHQKRHRPDKRAERRRHAAEHDHHDEIARARPMHGGRADEAGVIGKERACEPAERARDHEASQAIAIGWKADRPHATVVRARALHHHPETRVDQPPDQIDRGDEDEQAEIVEHSAVGEIEEIAE